MIAIDTNLLVYAHREESPWHGAARECVRRLAEGPEPWAIPWQCLHEFVGIVTHPRVFKHPTPLPRVFEQVEKWFESPSLVFLAEAEGYWPVLRETLHQGRVSGPRVHDARIVALCRLHGIRELWTADRDFGRFRGVRVKNPLA